MDDHGTPGDPEFHSRPSIRPAVRQVQLARVPRRRWEVSLGLLFISIVSLWGWFRAESAFHDIPIHRTLMGGMFLLFLSTSLLAFLVRMAGSRFSYRVTNAVMYVQVFWFPFGTSLFVTWLLVREEEAPSGEPGRTG